MGEQNINSRTPKTVYLQHLLHDIEALDILLAEGKIESGIQRIGAEQEFSLVESNFRPSRFRRKLSLDHE